MLFFFFFLIVDLNVWIPAVIAQFFIPTAELVIPTGTQTNEADAEIETQPEIVDSKISSVQLIWILAFFLIYFTY